MSKARGTVPRSSSAALTRYRPRSPADADHPYSSPDLARRRRHRPSLLLHAPAAASSSRPRSTSTSTSRSTRRSRTTTSSSTRRSSASRHVDEIDHPIIRAALAAPRRRPVARDRQRRRHPRRDRTGIVRSRSRSGSSAFSTPSSASTSPPATWPRRRRTSRSTCLGDPAGKQDHYIAAFGGITCFEFEPDGTVHVSPLTISTATLHDLEEHLLMFFTGYSREAAALLDDQRTQNRGGRRRRWSQRSS